MREHISLYYYTKLQKLLETKTWFLSTSYNKMTPLGLDNQRRYSLDNPASIFASQILLLLQNIGGNNLNEEDIYFDSQLQRFQSTDSWLHS